MSPSTPSLIPSTTPAKSATKSAKQSKKVILRLSSTLLAQFPSDSVVPKQESISNDNSLPGSTPTINAPAADKSSESNSTPAPTATPAPDSNSLAPPANGAGKKKGVPGPKPGTKRSAPPADGDSKPKGRPGPKKKPRLADGSIDRTTDPKQKGPFTGPAPISNHKLGPKGNMGAINAGLRALDRSGKPCRKWERKGFQLKSITGVSWTVGGWNAPPKDSSTFSGDVKSESSDSSEIKANMASSAIVSEQSNSGGDNAAQSNGLDSSPAPMVTVET